MESRVESWVECSLAASPLFKGFSAYLGGVLASTEQTGSPLGANRQSGRSRVAFRSERTKRVNNFFVCFCAVIEKNALLLQKIQITMILPFHIIQLLKSKSGSELRLPSDCEFLSLDIESKTGVRIGATTLKRLLGFAQDERTPHTSTLDAIARYLGYAHWEELSNIEDSGNSDFDSSDDEVRSADLQPGTCVEITYLPDRKVRMQYLGNQRYRIVESINSKLQIADEVEIQNFVFHHPLLVLNVWRGGEPLGQFTAGRVSGLSSVSIL